MRDVFIVGSKGIPASYGGFETFVDKLTEYHERDAGVKYHVACMSDSEDEFTYNGARCFNIRVINIGPVRAVYYDIAALSKCVRYIESNGIKNPIVYVLACRIGPWMNHYVRVIHELGGVVYVNPDGHEWKRGKWSDATRHYWKLSEKLMVKHADLLVCDSVNIEKYIKTEYSIYSPKTIYIPYGAEVVGLADSLGSGSADGGKEAGGNLSADSRKSVPGGDAEEAYKKWLSDNGLEPGGYYLMVGRFVPENNHETAIREFMKSKTKKSLVIITTRNDKLMGELKSRLGFEKDARIRILTPVYDQAVLMLIRSNAFAYIHGHEVGGTNPSLLEALGSTAVNLLFDVGFNREVGHDAALYWNKKSGSLSALIDRADRMDAREAGRYADKARKRILTDYTWKKICDEYKNLWDNAQKV